MKDDFGDSILKSLESATVKKEKTKNKLDKEFDDISDAIEGDTNQVYNDSLPMSQSEKDTIRSQIEQKWNVSSFNGMDLRNVDLRVVLHIKLDVDGTVLDVKVVKTPNSNSLAYRSMVESAKRAVYAASPLKNLPTNKYNTWKEIELPFNPSDLLY